MTDYLDDYNPREYQGAGTPGYFAPVSNKCSCA